MPLLTVGDEGDRRGAGAERRGRWALAAVVAATITACASGAPGPTASPTGPPATGSPGAGTAAPPAADPSVRPSAGCTATTSGTVDPGAPRTIDVDGTARTYRIAAPSSSAPAPLLVLLHGMGSSAADIDRVTGLDTRGPAAGTIVVTPDAVGSPTLWRAGGQGPDAALLDALIAEVERGRCVDTSRVAIAGFSVGAVFAAAYGCTHQDAVSAIVTVEVDAPGPCTRPLPILAFHGTADPIVPYAPPPGSPALGGGSGTEANLAAWARMSRCSDTPRSTEVGTEVTKLEWPGCADGSEVVLYKILGGAHDWPGKDPATSVHPSTQQVSATDEALAFVQRHPRRP